MLEYLFLQYNRFPPGRLDSCPYVQDLGSRSQLDIVGRLPNAIEDCNILASTVWFQKLLRLYRFLVVLNIAVQRLMRPNSTNQRRSRLFLMPRLVLSSICLACIVGNQRLSSFPCVG